MESGPKDGPVGLATDTRFMTTSRRTTTFADARGTILAMPGRSLMADAAPALASHQMSAGVVGVATEGSAFCRARDGLLRAFASLAPLLAAALAFGIQVADPLRDGGLPRLLGKGHVFQEATRFEAELLRHANISGRKPAA